MTQNIIKNRARKIIHITNVLSDDRYSGPARRIIDVAVSLSPFDVQTTLCLPNGDGNAVEAARTKNIRTLTVPFTWTPRISRLSDVCKWLINVPRDIKCFLRLFKREKPDIVHVNGAFFFIPVIAAKLSHVPVLWHLNDTMAPKLIARFLSWLVRHLSNKVVVAAAAVAQYYYLRSYPYVVIYAPVDVSQYEFIDLAATKSRNSCPKVALMANWNRLKGIDQFVSAVALAVKEYGPIELHFAGARLSNQKEYADRVDQLIDTLKLRSFVHEHGFVSSIPDFLKDIDLLVLSSISEACPIVVLEGMAAGIPVVATDVGGVREMLAPNSDSPAGIVVPVNNGEEMASAIVTLLKDREKSISFGKNGRKLAKQVFDLSVCANLHLCLYRKMVMDVD